MSENTLLLCGLSIILIFSAFLNAILISSYNRTHHELKNKQKQFSILFASALDGLRQKWSNELPRNIYRNEVEVEIKFVYPLLRFLGYSSNDLQARVDTPVQVGRKKEVPTADWVILKNGKPFFIIEAKKHNQQINEEVLAQARSYAYGLNISHYAVTNGREFSIYTRGNESDTRIMRCNIEQLEENWEKLKAIIGK
jgi:hypothetical protein